MKGLAAMRVGGDQIMLIKKKVKKQNNFTYATRCNNFLSP